MTVDPFAPSPPITPDIRRIVAGIDWRRVAITLAMLAVLRIGAAIPLPGLNIDYLLSTSVMSPGAVERMSVMALSNMPWFSAALLFELFVLLVPSSAKWRIARSGHVDPFNAWVLALTVALAVWQASGVLSAYDSINGALVSDGTLTRLAIMGGMVGGVAVLIACARIIDRLGIGNGFWVVIAAQVLFALPQAVLGWIELLSAGHIGIGVVVIDLALVAVCIAAIVFLFRALKSSRAGGVEDILWPAVVASMLTTWIVSLFIIFFPALTGSNLGGSFLPLDVVRIAVITCAQALFLWIALGRAKSRGLFLPALAALFLVASVPVVWSWIAGYSLVFPSHLGAPESLVALIGLLVFLISENEKTLIPA